MLLRFHFCFSPQAQRLARQCAKTLGSGEIEEKENLENEDPDREHKDAQSEEDARANGTKKTAPGRRGRPRGTKATKTVDTKKKGGSVQIEKKNKDEKQTENPSKRKKTEKLHEGKEGNVSDSKEKPSKSKKSKKNSVASPEETKEDTVPEKEIPQGLSDREAWDVRSNSYVCP